MIDSVKKKALITGVTGQDGSYLADFLLDKGYEVHGVVRTSSIYNRERISHLYTNNFNRHPDFYIHYGDLTDANSLNQIVKEVKPNEIYNLAAQSNIWVAFIKPEYTTNVNALGVIRLLESIKLFDLGNKTRFFQASTCDFFENTGMQNESSLISPKNPYATSKAFAHYEVQRYRQNFGYFACNGIFFNHESPRRPENYVSRKISQGLAKVKLGLQDKLLLGNLDSKKDWGFAGDYVEAIWKILQQEKPEDYIIASGETHSVREFVEEACKVLGFDLEWQGEGINEKGIDKNSGKEIIAISDFYFRPHEKGQENIKQGDISKIKEQVGWQPKTSLKELVEMMIKSDLENLRR